MTISKLSKNAFARIISGLALLVLFTQTHSLIAQVNQSVAPEYGMSIDSVTLDKDSYQYGETIKGTFVAENDSNVSISNARYVVYLVGDFDEDSIPSTYYENTISEPFFIDVNENKEINFEYTLPRYKLGGDLGIEVSVTLDSGIPLSWANTKMQLASTGYIQTVDVTNAYLQKGERKYGVFEGPTVSSDEELSLEVAMENNNGEAVEIYPSVTLFNRSDNNTPIDNFDLEAFSIAANSAYDFSYSIDNTLDPGVYPSKIDFKDKDGNRISRSVYYQYIVEGESATIYNVSLDTLNVEKGDQINVEITHAGTPYDVDLVYDAGAGDVNFANDSQQNYVIEVVVTDENGNVVAEGSKQSDFAEQISTKLSLTADRSGDQLSVSATVKKGDEVLATYSTELPQSNENHSEPGNTFLSYSIVIIVIVILIILFMILKKFMHKMDTPISLMTALIVSSSLVLLSNVVYSWTDNGTSNLSNDIINPITLSIDAINDTYAPGEDIRLKGSAVAWSCNNYSRRMIISYKIDDGSWVTLVNQGLSGGGNDRFQGTPSTNFDENVPAPTTPGTHDIYVNASLNVFKYLGQEGGGNSLSSNYAQKKDTFVVLEQEEPGICGSADGKYKTSAPSGVEACSSGSLGAVSGNNPYSWSCNGTGGNTTNESCSTKAPQCRDGIDNDGDGRIDESDDGCNEDTEDIDDNENDVSTDGVSCRVISPSGFPYDLNSEISIQAFLTGFTDSENVNYTWSGSFANENATTEGNAIFNSFDESGNFVAQLTVSYEGNEVSVTCTTGEIVEDGEDNTNILVANPPEILFDIPIGLSEGGYCEAEWSIGTGDPVECRIVTEFGEPLGGTIASDGTSEKSGSPSVPDGNKYRLECVTTNLEDPIEIVTDYNECRDPNLIEQ